MKCDETRYSSFVVFDHNRLSFSLLSGYPGTRVGGPSRSLERAMEGGAMMGGQARCREARSVRLRSAWHLAGASRWKQCKKVL